MDNETHGASAAPPVADADNALSADWDSILTDPFSPTETSDGEPPQGDAGAPPAATGETPSSEGDQAAAHAGDTPADAAKPEPDAAPPSPPADELTPFTYTVNGETRTADGVYRTPDGIVIEADKADWFAQRMSERDHYYEKDQQTYAQLQSVTDSLSKLTSWQITNARGEKQTLSGADAVEAQRVQLGRALAENVALHAAIRDPKQLSALVTAQQDRDGTWYIVPNTDGLEQLGIRLDRDGMRVEQMARQAMQSIRAGLRAGPTPPAVPAGPTDQQVLQTVKNAAKELGISNLTSEDETFLARQLPRYIRDATDAEKPMLGARVLDADFRAVLHQQSSQRSALAKTAATASKAGQENAAAIRAANVGKRPPLAAPSTPAKPAPQPTSQDDAWDARERAARAAMTRRAG